jgi:hypothetical protein
MTERPPSKRPPSMCTNRLLRTSCSKCGDSGGSRTRARIRSAGTCEQPFEIPALLASSQPRGGADTGIERGAAVVLVSRR